MKAKPILIVRYPKDLTNDEHKIILDHLKASTNDEYHIIIIINEKLNDFVFEVLNGSDKKTKLPKVDKSKIEKLY